MEKITDGPENTICVILWMNSGIDWLEPRDATIDEAINAIHNSSREEVAVLFADSRSIAMSRDTPDDVLRAAMTANGGEPPIDWTQCER